MQKKVAIFLAKGFEETEAITVIDLLRRVNIIVDVFSINSEKNVTGSHNITIIADLNILNNLNINNYDAFILPGGMPGVTNLMNSKILLEKLILAFNKNKLIAAICAAPQILGFIKIIEDNQEITTFPGENKYLSNANINSKASVVFSKNILTSQSLGTAINFSLKLVELLLDYKTSKELKKRLVII